MSSCQDRHGIRWSKVRHIAALGEPLLELQPASGDQIQLSIGGDVANFMLCLARVLRTTGPQLSLVTSLGNGAYSAWLRNRIEREGIGVIEWPVSGEPGIYGIPPDRNEHGPFSYWRTHSAAHHLFQKAGFEEFTNLVPLADLLVITGITLALCSPESFECLVHWMTVHDDCPVVFDLNYRSALWESKEEARRRIAVVENLAAVIATGVEDERSLREVTGPQTIMERLGRCAAECIVRAGGDGCWVGSGSHWDYAPTTRVTVVDPVGAGDAHLAGYIAARINGCGALKSAGFANSVASRIVSQRGSAPGDDVVFPDPPTA